MNHPPHAIRTVRGAWVDLLNPSGPALANMAEIAVALSNICRFTGHVKKFYSVAQHSVYVSRIMATMVVGKESTRAATIGLLHDISEAFLSDVSAPLKQYRGMSGYVQLEAGWQRMLYVLHGIGSLTSYEKQLLHTADKSVAAWEALQLQDGWDDTPYTTDLRAAQQVALEVLGDTLVPLTPEDAANEFLREYDRLYHTRLRDAIDGIPSGRRG